MRFVHRLLPPLRGQLLVATRTGNTLEILTLIHESDFLGRASLDLVCFGNEASEESKSFLERVGGRNKIWDRWYQSNEMIGHLTRSSSQRPLIISQGSSQLLQNRHFTFLPSGKIFSSG